MSIAQILLFAPLTTMAASTESGSAGAHKMGLIACTSYVVGNIIGSGIFITAGDVASQSGSVGLTLVLWLACAALSFLGALVYVELATSIIEPGADYAYAMHIGWKAMAFTFMIVSVLITFPASAAVQSTTFGNYLKKFFVEILGAEDSNPGGLDPIVIGLAVLLLVITTAINFYALDKFAARFQVLVTICKMGAIVLIVGIGLWYLIKRTGRTENFNNIFEGSKWGVGSLTMGIYGGLWSYAGWDILNYGTPEIHKPRRTMPLSLLLGLAVVCIAYLLINTSFFVALSLEEVKNSTAIGSDFAQATLGGGLAKVIPIMISILVMGTLNSNIFCGSRILHAAAREGQLPAFLSGINPDSGSPRPAILLQTLISIVMCVVPTDKLVNAVTFVMWAQKAVTAAALLWIRYKGVAVESGAIRVPIVLTWLLLISSIALVVIPFVEQTEITLFGCGVIFLAFVVYFLAIRFELCGCNGFYKRISDVVSSIAKRVLCVEMDLKPPASDPQEREELNSVENEKM